MLRDELRPQSFAFLNRFTHSRGSKFVGLRLARQEYGPSGIRLYDELFDINPELRVQVHRRVDPCQSNSPWFLHLQTRIYAAEFSAEFFKSSCPFVVFGFLLLSVLNIFLHNLGLAACQFRLMTDVEKTPNTTNSPNDAEQPKQDSKRCHRLKWETESRLVSI
jgi:hypothetical protein